MDAAFATTPRKRSTARGDDARGRLIAAAARLFAARGYDGVSVRELARAAHVNVASVSYHFGGKRDLYLAALASLMDAMAPIGGPVIKRIDVAFADGPPDRTGLAELAAFVVRHLVTAMHAGDLPPWVTQTVLREFQEPSPDYRPMFDKRVLPLHHAMRRLTAAALDTPEDSDAAIMATHALVGQIMVFAAARAVALEELDWPDFSGERLTALIEATTAGVLRTLGLSPAAETA